MDIGHRMKELRIQYGLTQQELADRAELKSRNRLFSNRKIILKKPTKKNTAVLNGSFPMHRKTRWNRFV